MRDTTAEADVLANLTAAVKAGGDIPALVAELKTVNARLVDVRRRLEPREQHDREQLRAALEHRVDEWREILRANPAQGRQVLHHLIGPITIWPALAAVMTEAPLEGFDPRSTDGKEGITAADVREGIEAIRWTATARPAGLLAGLRVVQQVASPTGLSDVGVIQGGTSPAGFEPAFWP